MDFLNALFPSKKSSSKEMARDRLKLVLIQDRINCSPDLLEMLKNDILKVISNYMEIDEEELEFEITNTATENNDNSSVLYANIPIKSMRKM